MSRTGGTSTSEGRETSTASSGERLLRVENDNGKPLAELVVEVDGQHTVGQMVQAIAYALGGAVGPGRPDVRRRRGRSEAVLSASQPVLHADLLSGDTLVLAGADRASAAVPGETRAPLELVVAAGPDVGARLALTPGRHEVGRGADRSLPLTDPTVSRRHMSIAVTDDDVQLHLERGATTGPSVSVDGAPVTDTYRWQPGQLVRLGSTTLALRRPPTIQRLRPDRTGLLPFQRTPYFPEPVEEVTIPPFREIPTKPEPPQPAYVAAVAPLVMAVAVAVLYQQPRFLLFAVLSPITVIGSYIDQRRRNKKRYAEAMARFEAELSDRSLQVEQALAEERRRRLLGGPDLSQLADRVEARSADLWVRGRSAEDFLHLRAGLGPLPTLVTTQRPEGGDAEIRDRVDEAFGDTDTLTDVPVLVDLVELTTVGIVGRNADATGVANSFLMQAATLHSPEDLVVAIAADPDRGLVNWAHWLPHCRSASSPLTGAHLAWTTPDGEDLVSRVLAAVAEAGSEPSSQPQLLLVLDNRLDLDPTLVSRLLDMAGHTPLTVLWLAAGSEEVPRQAGAVIEVRSIGSSAPTRLQFAGGHRAPVELEPERLRPETAAALARSLAPLRDASSAGAATALPRVAPLFAALGLGHAHSEATIGHVRSAWLTALSGGPQPFAC